MCNNLYKTINSGRLIKVLYKGAGVILWVWEDNQSAQPNSTPEAQFREVTVNCASIKFKRRRK